MILTLSVATLIALNGLRSALHESAETVASVPVAEAIVCLGNLDVETVILALDRIGFSADTLAAAGVTPEQAGAAAVALAAALEEDPAELDRLDEDVGALRAIADGLAREVHAGTASPETVAALGAASAAYLLAESSRAARHNDLRAASAAGLSADVREKLHAAIDQGVLWSEVPAPYRLANRPEAGMMQLREALTCERLALEDGVDLSAEAVAVLAAVRQEPDVALALATWTDNAALIEAAWLSGAVH